MKYFLISLLLAVVVVADDLEEIRILCTGDLHGYVEERNKGMLRIASLIRLRKEAFGTEKTLLIDCGDTFQGSFEATACEGELPARILELLEPDVFVPGNHEFDFGVERFLELSKPFKSRILAGNLKLNEHEYPVFNIFQCGKARVLVIGAAASYMPNWLWGDQITGLSVTSAFDMIKDNMKKIVELKPDLVVLAAHQGWTWHDSRGVNEIKKTAEMFPEIDLILGAHTHRSEPGRRIGNGTWYVQPPPHGEGLAEVRISTDIRRHDVVNISSRLYSAEGIPPDAKAKGTISEQLDDYRKLRNQPLAFLSCSYSSEGLPGESCKTAELLAEAFFHATDADVVLHGKLSEFSLSKGPLTEYELYRLVPYENNLVSCTLTSEELNEILAEQQKNKRSYTYCGVFWKEESENPEERLLVVLNSYTAAGAGGRFPILRRIINRPQANLKDLHINTRTAVRIYLKNTSENKDVFPPHTTSLKKK